MLRSTVGPTGAVSMRVIRAPKIDVLWKMRNFINVWRGAWRFAIADFLGIATLKGRLYLKINKADGSTLDYGLVSTRVVTTAFVNEMVDQLVAEDATWGDFRWHDSGIGTTGAAVGDTDIETTDGQSRAEDAVAEESAANIYKTIATISYDGGYAITEHGVFNAEASGELMDRHVFSAVNVVDGDSIEFTYELTVSAGG